MRTTAASTGTASRLVGRGALLLLLAATAGCSGHRVETAPTPSSRGERGTGVTLRENWRARVVVDRDDSIILTLPSGAHQLQRFSRRAAFTLRTGDDGSVSLRLDSLVVRPPVGADAGNPVGATWTAQLAGDRLNDMRVSGGNAGSAAALTPLVRDLLPRLPTGGVRAGRSWADTSSGPVTVDIFSGSERRTSSWATGSASPRGSTRVLPVTLREDFEQLGTGTEGGQRMSMTSQGRRNGTYYLTGDGRISDAQLDDSVAMLISIAKTRQLIPTIRYSRTSVHFFSLARDQSQ
jgi:hypothetical protein